MEIWAKLFEYADLQILVCKCDTEDDEAPAVKFQVPLEGITLEHWMAFKQEEIRDWTFAKINQEFVEKLMARIFDKFEPLGRIKDGRSNDNPNGCR